MAHIEQENTATLDLIGQGENKLSQGSGAAGENATESRVDDGAAGMRDAGDSEEGKEAEPLPRKLSPATMNASDQADNPDLQTTHLHSVLTPPAPAVSPSPTRPALVQLNSSQSHSGSSTPTVATAPHPKKFSSSNINKKFLEKTTPAPGAVSAMVTNSNSTKSSGNGISKPPSQTSSPHPRLVTTKLTATTPAPSSVAGWSRPSSTAPPTSTTGGTSPNSATPAPSVPTITTSSTSAPAAPQLPHPGKAFQQGPRSTLGHQQTVPGTLPNKDGGPNASTGPSSKPVWGNPKPPTTAISRPEVASNDFPTAAEVAQGTISTRKIKPTDQSAKEAPTSPSTMTSSKPSRSEEADTFRGVHLDPNAHHWDEMVEDDDNYWDNVIEFGDGRQYKVEVAEQTSRSRESSPSGAVKSSQSTKLESTTEVPVSKEERFADDFDRSWPSGPRRGPSVSAQQPSPQEPPRVLFNERSNKMEPYSNHRGGPGSFPSKRGGYQDRMVSPTEPRSASIAFSKSGGGPPDFGSSRSRRFSTTSNSSFVSVGDRDRQRDKDKRDGLPPSPRMPKGEVGLPGRPPSLRGRDRDSEKGKDFDRGRHGAMGPPPIPAHAWRNPSRESARHRLSVSGSVNGAPPRRQPTDESSEFQGPSHVAHDSLHSPVLSQASMSTKGMISPLTPSLPLPGLVHDLEELKKDVMQSAAARAKQRRQQEEEEREAQKERARRKAAELEVKMKADVEEKARNETEAEQIKKELEQERASRKDGRASDDEANLLIREALEAGGKEKADADLISKQMHRRPLPQPSNDSIPSRRLTPTTGPPNGVPSVSDAAETWRRNGPLPRQPDEPILLQRRSSSSVAFMPPPPPAPLDHIQTLADGKQEDLEVVDFTDMGKFVGETASRVSSAEQKEAPRRVSRPVASDFFDDVPSSLNSQPLSPSVQNDIDTWRRKTPLIQITTSDQQTKGLVNKDRPEGNFVIDASTPEQVYKANEGLSDSRYPSQVSPQSQRTPRTQNFYHQAPMSSLVDAMSRIKGAIHDMHAEEQGKEINPPEAEAPVVQTQSAQSLTIKLKERWVPPSLRRRTVEFQEEIPEEFYRTVMEPPQSPKLTWNNLVVRLPQEGQEREQIHRKQLQFFSRPQVFRWDILSFEPPVEGMTKRSFSVNDVLFRPPFGGFKGKIKYRVHLPRSKSGPRSLSAVPMSSRTNSYGAFGKQNGADASTSWRKPTSLPLARSDAGDEGVAEVNATSRSPPPEPESSSPAVGINLKVEVSQPESIALPARTRSQPKMPEGSGVAFYRGSRIDVPEAEPKLLVNFIVSSEIDDPQSPQSDASKEPIASSSANGAVETIHEPVIDKGSNTSAYKSNGDETKDGKTVSPPVESETARLSDSKSSDMPSRQPSPWSTSRSVSVKESPARAPDPEHLKAVWSQTSDKAGSRTVNSLEGIADDLTSLPFTLQDVKSEDGATPPPAPGTSSSRMSLHDVTRAFQQVPSSSASTPSKPPISPPSTTAPVARPSPSNYSYSVPPNNMRPAYATYPSPMMSHSPSPTMMYPQMVSSPVPTRIQGNGHTPVYNPPTMWVPVQHQNANNMMRPMGPYAPPMMAYPPNGAPAMYPSAIPANMPGTPQSQTIQANRHRNMPVMSPIMQHAGPHMYPASPAMMHMQMTPTSGFMPLPAGRGQTRAENGQVGMQPAASTHPPSSQVGFSPIPPSPFMRNW